MAFNVGELAAILSLDDDKFNKGMDNADDKTGKLGATASKTGMVVGAAMVTAGVAAAGFGYKATMAASDLGESMSKTDNVFKANSKEIHDWAAGAAKDFGQSRRQAEDAAGSFGNLFVQLGIGRGKAAEMSMQMTELASDFASFHNADISEVIGAQTAAFRGEYDALQRFVPTINAAAVEQKALEMTHKGTTKELTLQEKALATQKLMMEGAGDAAGDFDRTNTGLANRLRIAEAATEDFSSRVGGVLLPIVLDAWDAFDKLSGVVGPVLSGAFDKVKGAVMPVINSMSDLVTKGYGIGNAFDAGAKSGGQVTEDMNKLDAVFAKAGGGAEILKTKGTEMFGKLKGEAAGAKEAFMFGSGGEDWMSIGPIEQAAETLGSVFDNVREIATSFFETVHEWVGENEGRFSEWQAKIGEIFGVIVEIVTMAWEAIGLVFDIATNLITGMWDRFGKHLLDHLATAFDSILQVLGGVFDVIKGIFNVFIGVFTGDWSRAWDGVKGIFGGIWDAIVGILRFALNLVSTVIGAAMAAISLAWGYVWNGIKGVISTVWDWITGYIKGQINLVVGVMKGIGGLVSDAVSGAFDGLKSAFTGAINFIIRKWNDLSFGIPAIDVPGIGKVGGVTIDTPNIPLLAKGGRVIGSGLAIVGDEGPEIMSMRPGASVIPLPETGGSNKPVVEIGKIEINGVRDGDDVLRVLPDLESALLAGVGRS